MSLCLQAAFGVHPVMSLIKLWKTVFFLSWMWEIGLSLITWEQILSMNHLLSMIFRGQLFITWCHTVIGKMDFYFFLKQIGYLRWQGLLVLILWWMHNLKVLTEWSFKHNWKTSYFIVLFIVHLLCGFMVFVLKFKCLDFFFSLGMRCKMLELLQTQWWRTSSLCLLAFSWAKKTTFPLKLKQALTLL